MTEILLFREALGRVLRIRRTILGLTLQDVAVRAGVSVQYLSEVERGLKDASSEMVAAIAGALDLQLHEVLVLTAQISAPAGAAAVSAAGLPGSADTFGGSIGLSGAPAQASLALAA